jgi:hypothetical protein
LNKKKATSLFGMEPDIAIVQECSKSDAESLQGGSYSSLWFGENPKKGLAIFYKSQWTLRQLAEPDHRWIVPLEVKGPENFTLLAVWAWSEKGGIPSYVRLIRQFLAAHPIWFGNGPVVMAGDFNSNCQWDKAPSRDHFSLVEQLAQHGLISAYHSHHNQQQGSETRPTFHKGRKSDNPYHIDYIFMPREWIARLDNLEVGTFDDWARLSDHCPLTIDVANS